MSVLDILKIITLFLLAIIMFVFIVMEIKALFFIRDVNKSLDEIIDYLKSFNWVFDIIDFVTEKAFNFKDKFSYILSIFFRK